MDCMGAILEGDWSCLSEMYTTGQEADFMSQLLTNFPLPEDETRIPSFFWHANADSNSSSDSFILSSSSSHESYYLTNSHPVFTSPMSMDFCMEDGTNTTSFLVEPDDCFNTRNVQKDDRVKKLEPTTETEMPIITENNSKKTTPSSAEMPKPEPIFTQKNSKKRTPSSGDVQKTKRNARSKKNQSGVSNSIANNDEECNGGLNGQSWASCSSEDDSQELKQEAAVNLNGKTRASRGAATDPQSLYARKRRERINERLRILQNLVPNGTKVDISTMLEEAVQYVKFLQLQIKLLSSDDHWMYAPIAYNGMDIGLDLLPNIS